MHLKMKIIKNIFSKGCSRERRIKVVQEHPRIYELEESNQRQMAVPPTSVKVHLHRFAGLVKALAKNSVSSPVEIFHSWKNTVYIHICIYIF